MTTTTNTHFIKLDKLVESINLNTHDENNQDNDACEEEKKSSSYVVLINPNSPSTLTIKSMSNFFDEVKTKVNEVNNKNKL